MAKKKKTLEPIQIQGKIDKNLHSGSLDNIQEVAKSSINLYATSSAEKRNRIQAENLQKKSIQREIESQNVNILNDSADEVRDEFGVGPITYFEKNNDFTISEIEKKMETMIVTLQQIQEGENLKAKDDIFEKI